LKQYRITYKLGNAICNRVVQGNGIEMMGAVAIFLDEVPFARQGDILSVKELNIPTPKITEEAQPMFETPSDAECPKVSHCIACPSYNLMTGCRKVKPAPMVFEIYRHRKSFHTLIGNLQLKTILYIHKIKSIHPADNGDKPYVIVA
jgi:hypothetical protein